MSSTRNLSLQITRVRCSHSQPTIGITNSRTSYTSTTITSTWVLIGSFISLDAKPHTLHVWSCTEVGHLTALSGAMEAKDIFHLSVQQTLADVALCLMEDGVFLN